MLFTLTHNTCMLLRLTPKLYCLVVVLLLFVVRDEQAAVFSPVPLSHPSEGQREAFVRPVIVYLKSFPMPSGYGSTVLGVTIDFAEEFVSLYV